MKFISSFSPSKQKLISWYFVAVNASNSKYTEVSFRFTLCNAFSWNCVITFPYKLTIGSHIRIVSIRNFTIVSSLHKSLSIQLKSVFTAIEKIKIFSYKFKRFRSKKRCFVFGFSFIFKMFSFSAVGVSKVNWIFLIIWLVHVFCDSYICKIG